MNSFYFSIKTNSMSLRNFIF
ncbi:hypothetical protein Zm00014a_024955 [Zea mays]|uniref:Uncharacterized protein n=1 Tax=Zea mays TaxID=4577 RepID=A0A3L6EIB1_MAIZE|nr:hypothetical protein Zm00014a_024955 [Zea mays]